MKPPKLVIRGGADGLRDDLVRRQALIAQKQIGVLGISTVAVWDGETVDEVWDRERRLSTVNVVWEAVPEVLERRGFMVVKTLSAARHFTIVLPDTEPGTIALLKSLMFERRRQ